MTEEGSDPAFAASLPTAQLVECLCQSSWDVSDRSFTDFLGIAGQGVIQGMEPADWPRLVDTLEVMLHHRGSSAPARPPAAPRAACAPCPMALPAALKREAARCYTTQSAPGLGPGSSMGVASAGLASRACVPPSPALPARRPLMGSASNLCSPKCKAAIQAYLSALTKSSNTLYTQAGLPQVRHPPASRPPKHAHPSPHPHPGRLRPLPSPHQPLAQPLAHVGSPPAAQEVAAIAGMTDADAASEVECLCAWDLTSMLRDLKPLLTRARELMSQPAQQAGEQPGTGLLGQGGHGGQGGQHSGALLGKDGHGQWHGQGQGQEGEEGESMVDEMLANQSVMLEGIAAAYILKKVAAPGGLCPSLCNAGSGAAPPASNCDVASRGKGGKGDEGGEGGKGEVLSSSLLSIETKQADSQALGTSTCPGGGGGGGAATAAAVIFALLFAASSTAAFYFYRKAELGGRAKTAQTAISNAQAGSEATIWRIDPLSPAQGADNLRPPQQM